MDKKARSKPMCEIVKRLLEYGEFEVNIFGDDTILHKTIGDWPNCDCLLTWHSEGFPLKKAALYAAERKPFLINDVSKQHLLLDRRKVYGILKETGIPVPNHVIISRDGPDGNDPKGLVEKEDYIEFQGQKIHKPFVEKPASGEDHNIYIYYPAHMGGGVKKLYRKINNKSADYELNHPGTIRRNGSFIYEEFLATGGTDVKVYTVGTRYAHAEARKSPVVDGKVQRTKQGKEVRFPVLLSPPEKEIARLVTFAFGQKVCGFDLLRSDKGKSYVCDVNGWSFVKSSYKYYDDAAGILRSIILAAIAPHRLTVDPSRFPPLLQKQASPSKLADQMRTSISYNDVPQAAHQDVNGNKEDDPRYQWEELRCVLAIVRHGDRTPKQKMKMRVTQAPILELFEKHKDKKGKEAKLKSPKQLQELLDITRRLVQEMPTYSSDDPMGGEVEKGYETRGSEITVPEFSEIREKYQILVNVLEAGGHFAGINRKVQLKPLAWSSPREGQSERRVEEVMLILKHGGVLTHAGRQQTEDLGKYFRTAMYPSNGAEMENGLLRLHSTYRHDLKIYSSDEGRVQASAAAFTKGLLDLEGSSLTPILASLVKKETGMLDACDKATDDIQAAKLALYEQLTRDTDSTPARFARPPGTSPRTTPPRSPSVPFSGGDSMSPEPLPLAQSMELLQDEQNSAPPHRRADEPGAVAGCPPGISQDPPTPIKGDIQGLPPNALKLLYRLVDLLQDLVDQLYQKVKMEGCMTRGTAVYSSLSQDPSAWMHEPNKPCCGERPLLLYDRWRKLSRSFYKRTRDTFDISKVPDIYDSVKYDAIHNQHLDLKLEDLYETARALAVGVVPNEYGVSPEGKLQIGSQISSLLLGKLLADLGNTREESKATANLFYNPKATARDAFAAELGAYGFDDYPMNLPNIGSKATKDDVDSEEDNEGGDQEESDSTLHRLCPSYAVNINSPMRHVRTRVYFTSESHIHALVNVLRYCHRGVEGAEPIVCESGQNILTSTPELDYLSHIVFRMYENQQVHISDPLRFRVEVLFSPGAAYNPFEVMPLRRNHTLPVHPRVELHQANGATLDYVEKLVARFSTPRKLQTPALNWLPCSNTGSAPTYLQRSGLRKPSLSVEQPTVLPSE
ncbi:unnamed protein product [Ostreobium quekettii]|uniref:Inositol hexakisphosphate and diphosphoinositol-pentakisphosphate kinase n=1 Tax=Ostreobium quekettii TaxID=121088 RepID=A0A8S1IRS6_9CHLO|nr:unnamed protein product [Ostreobium quekettii]|eukprot:evm.model.scf_292.8 EVM.evm.TU.scf_292.8   scf_292:74571-92366(-)